MKNVLSCNLLHLLIVYQILNSKSISSQENCSEDKHHNIDEHQFSGVYTNSALIENSPKKKNKTNLTSGNKSIFKSTLQYLSSTIQRMTLSDEDVRFDVRKREDSYKKTDPKEYPYAVFLLMRGDYQSMCSGSLITAEWVLTSAHCLYDSDPGAKPHSIWIYAGGTSYKELFYFLNYNKTLPSTAQLTKSGKFIYHPKYPFQENSYDIGLVKTIKPFKITKTVNYIKLSITPWRHRGYKICETTGFGVIYEKTATADDLHRKTMFLEVKKPCLCNFMVRFTNKLDGDEGKGRLLCAKPRQYYGICSGDSGGGLACEENGELRLRGIGQSSTGFDNVKYCELALIPFLLGFREPECAEENVISMFQDVYLHLPWLNEHLKMFDEKHMSAVKKHVDSVSAAPMQSPRWAFPVTGCFVILFFFT